MKTKNTKETARVCAECDWGLARVNLHWICTNRDCVLYGARALFPHEEQTVETRALPDPER